MTPDASPPGVVWTNRGFRWSTATPRATLPPVLLPVAGLAGLVGALFAVGIAIYLPSTLVVSVPLGIAAVAGGTRWALHIAATPCSVELAGRTVRYRARHVLVELDLERVGLSPGPGSLTMTEGDERIVVEAGTDAAWLFAALTEAQQTWRAQRGGPMPDAERVALARMRDPS